MARRDAIAAGFVLAFAAVAIQQSAGLPFGRVHNPGPGFFPWWASVILEALALILLAQVVLRRAPEGAQARGRLVKVGALLVVLGAYAFLLEPLGYPACTFLLVLFMLRVIDPHPWPLALGLAFLGAAGSYALFAVWLTIPLPAGLWPR